MEIKIIDRVFPNNSFYKAASAIVWDSEIQDYRNVIFGTIDNKTFNIEVYQGPNYVIESNAKRNWSRQYSLKRYPSKLNATVKQLEEAYNNHFNK
jgi:hypothetical protein